MSTEEHSSSGEHVDPALAEAIEDALAGVTDEFTASATPEGEASQADSSSSVEQETTAPTEEGEAEETLSELDKAKADAAQAADDLARARADLYNLQQEYQGFVRRSREAAAGHRETGKASVVEALIPVLDEIELARQHGDLTGPFEAMSTKLESILGDKFGLVRFGEAGEVFDPTLHEALMAVESSEVEEPTVNLVLQPGYKLGDKVVRAARVQVANPA